MTDMRKGSRESRTSCHPERSEGSLRKNDSWKSLRGDSSPSVQNDKAEATGDGGTVSTQVAFRPLLEVRGLACGYDGVPVVEGLSFTIAEGEVCALLGPNGVGKTTVFKAVLGHLPALAGTVSVAGQDASTLSRAQLARLVGYVPQAHTPPFPYTVAEVVEMGRTAHLALTSSPSAKDRRLALEALNSLGIAHLHDKPYTQISGGERQLALIARALCQQAKLLILDEPCANLDFGNRARVLRQVRELANRGMAVLMTTHDPDHALAIADSVVALIDRTHFVAGKPSEVIDATLLQELYGVTSQIDTVITPSGSVRVAVPY